MKKSLVKAGVLAVVFLLAVVGFELVLNTSGEDLTTTMADATLPILYFEENGEPFNPLYGYSQEMEPVFTRDSITPLYGDLSLPIRIEEYKGDIQSIRYEIRTLDSSRLIENTTVDDYETKDDVTTAILPIKNLLDNGIEYQLVITVTTDKQEVFYYTRVMIPSEMYVQECVAFAKDFHEKTFDKSAQPELAKYMEPESARSNDNLYKVDIHSSMNQLFWADFEGSILSKEQVSVKEIKKEYTVVILSYVLGATGDKGESEYYNVQEYYRIRYSAERMYLLDFERTMSQIFREDGDNYNETGINLGIRSAEVNYISNETGTILGFVQEGDLWEYNNVNESLIKVFSFRGYEQIDIRENNAQHSIRIIRVDETGSMDFIVYGYMNRGVHEGAVGISVFHYDSVVNSIEELIWIPFTKSYQMMDQVVGKVMYVNDNNQFFIMTEGIIHKIDLVTRKEEILEQGSGEDWLCVSQDNSCLAWVEGGNADAGVSLHLYNMATEQEKIIGCSADEYIRPLGYIENDLVYGLAKKDNVSTGVSGITVFPMHVLKIVDDDGTQMKQYEKKNVYIMGIDVDNYTIRLHRAKKSNGSYVAISEDTIMNMVGDSDEVTSLTTTTSEKKQKLITIQLSEKIADSDPNLLTAKIVDYPDDRSMLLESTGEENYYYAYAKGRVMLITLSVADAVMAASDHTGVVVDGKAQYIWQQAKSMYKETLSGMRADTTKVGSDEVERALSVILQHEGVTLSVGELLDSGRTAKQILRGALENATVLDLDGCSMDQMFYYVSQGYPVYAMASSHKPVLICGYTRERVTIYDPTINGTKTMSLNDAREMFEGAGDIFLAYVIKEDH